ncbi:hypothetical protein ACPV55_27255 [Vibrio mediterranei]
MTTQHIIRKNYALLLAYIFLPYFITLFVNHQAIWIEIVVPIFIALWGMLKLPTAMSPQHAAYPWLTHPKEINALGVQALLFSFKLMPLWMFIFWLCSEIDRRHNLVDPFSFTHSVLGISIMMWYLSLVLSFHRRSQTFPATRLDSTNKER